MKFLYRIAAVLAAATISSTSVVKTPSLNKDGNFELLILHNNDMHARFEQTSQLSGTCTTADREAGKCYGGFPRVAHVVKEARRAAAANEGPPVLYLNAGDTYTGTAWFTIYKWRIAAEFINALQPDAVSLGNHELDEAVEGVVPFIKNVSTPVLAANLILDKVPEMQHLKNLLNSTIINVQDVQVGVIGYLTPDTKFLAPRNKVEYEDEIVALKREVGLLKAQDVKIIIALGHSGFIKDLQIAKEVEDLDLVIGGHSNTFLWNKNTTDEKPEIPQGPYPTWVTQASGRKVPVVQAYAYTKYLGKLHLIFDSHGKIVQCNGTSVLLNQDIPRDPKLLELIKKYRSGVDVINNEVVGSSMNFLNGDVCRLRECNMGNIITDSVLYYTKKYYNDQFPDANIAIVQGGRIRASISKPGTSPFEITRGDLIAVLPFSDTLCVVTMNGTVLLQALEHSIAGWRIIDTPGQFIQVSGIRVVYDLARAPGSRVISAQAVCSKCSDPTTNYVQPNIKYEIIMPLFLADMGDGYSMFEGLEKEIVPYDEVTALIAYLKVFSPAHPSVSNRVIILNEDKVNYLDVLDEIDANILRQGRSLASVAITINNNFSFIIVVLIFSLFY